MASRELKDVLERNEKIDTVNHMYIYKSLTVYEGHAIVYVHIYIYAYIICILNLIVAIYFEEN